MVANLSAAMHDTLSELTWMSPETRQQALAKLAALHPNIGYPDKWKTYTGLTIVRNEVFAASKLLATELCGARPRF